MERNFVFLIDHTKFHIHVKIKINFGLLFVDGIFSIHHFLVSPILPSQDFLTQRYHVPTYLHILLVILFWLFTYIHWFFSTKSEHLYMSNLKVCFKHLLLNNNFLLFFDVAHSLIENVSSQTYENRLTNLQTYQKRLFNLPTRLPN